MFIIKKIMETLAIKRRQINLPMVRGLLIISCVLLLHLLWRGVLSNGAQIVQILMAVTLINDIIMLLNIKKIPIQGGE